MTADNDLLLEALGRALEPAPVEPPEERVAALRRRAELAVDSRRTWRGIERRPPRSVLVAAAIVVFVLGVVVGGSPPRTLRSVAYRVGLPVDSPGLVDARADIKRLSVALSERKRGVVIAADAAMLRAVAKLPKRERERLEPVAQQLHLRAVDFLTDDRASIAPPSSDASVGLEAEVAPQEEPRTPPPLAGRSASGTTTTTSRPSDAAPVPTVPAVKRRVLITRIHFEPATGRYLVDFRVSGFRPDSSGRPGTYVIHFYFDDGRTGFFVYAGESPWSFGLDAAATHHELCTAVADHTGDEDRSNGNCEHIPSPA